MGSGCFAAGALCRQTCAGSQRDPEGRRRGPSSAPAGSRRLSRCSALFRAALLSDVCLSENRCLCRFPLFLLASGRLREILEKKQLWPVILELPNGGLLALRWTNVRGWQGPAGSETISHWQLVRLTTVAIVSSQRRGREQDRT